MSVSDRVKNLIKLQISTDVCDAGRFLLFSATETVYWDYENVVTNKMIASN